MEGTQIGGKGGLISDGGWNTAEQGGHLRACLGESENVVDEQQDILVLFISEVLGDGETGETNAGSGAGWLVHLSVHESGLGALGVVLVNLDDLGFDHFVIEVVALAGTLANAGEHRVAAMRLGDVVDQLHDQHGLADTGTTKETDLTSLGVGAQEINDLDAYIIINTLG